MTCNKIFATRYVRCVGEVVGLVVAETRELAQRAAALVRVELAPMDDECIDFEQGIATNNLFPYDHSIQHGQPPADGAAALSDRVQIGGQHHWYLEPHALYVVPQVPHPLPRCTSNSHPSARHRSATSTP